MFFRPGLVCGHPVSHSGSTRQSQNCQTKRPATRGQGHEAGRHIGNQVTLVLLAPTPTARVVQTVQAVPAELADDQGPPLGSAGVKAAGYGVNHLLGAAPVIPARIDVEGGDVDHPLTEVVVQVPAGESVQAGVIPAEELHVAAEDVDGSGPVGGGLVQASPDDDGGVVHVLADHLPCAVQGLPDEKGVRDPGLVPVPGMALLPDQDPPLVAEVEKALVIGVVAGPDGVAARVGYELQILVHHRQGDGRTEGGVVLMTVDATQEDGTAVDAHPAPDQAHGTEAHPVDQIVPCRPRPLQGDLEGIEDWALRVPRLDLAVGEVHAQTEFAPDPGQQGEPPDLRPPPGQLADQVGRAGQG